MFSLLLFIRKIFEIHSYRWYLDIMFLFMLRNKSCYMHHAYYYPSGSHCAAPGPTSEFSIVVADSSISSQTRSALITSCRKHICFCFFVLFLLFTLGIFECCRVLWGQYSLEGRGINLQPVQDRACLSLDREFKRYSLCLRGRTPRRIKCTLLTGV